MLETGLSGLMSGDENRDGALASAPALVLDSTTVTVDPSYRKGMEPLTSSLDHIQHAASQILRAIEAGG